jgi:hypothetical protein
MVPRIHPHGTRIAIGHVRVFDGGSMVDREKVLAVLAKRFPGATTDQMAAAANAIVGLDDEWEEVTEREDQLGYHVSAACTDICYLAQQVERGDSFRLFRKRAVRVARY